MKKAIPWQMALLVAWPYAALAANLFLIRVGLAAWGCGLLGTVIVTGLNVRCALRQNELFSTVRLGMLVKLLHIPAYGLSALLTLMLWAAPPLLMALLLTNVCMLMATSAFTLRGVYLAWRSGTLTGGWAAGLAVSQCVFVLDVPGCIVLYAIEKRRSC